MEQDLIFDKEKKTWKLYVNGEYYSKGSYEYCNEMMINNSIYNSYEINLKEEEEDIF